MDAFHFDLSVVDLEKHEGAGSGKSIKGQRRVKPVSADVSHDGQVDPTLTANEIPVESQPGDKIRTTEAKAEKIYRSLTKFILPGLSRLITDKVRLGSEVILVYQHCHGCLVHDTIVILY